MSHKGIQVRTVGGIVAKCIQKNNLKTTFECNGTKAQLNTRINEDQFFKDNLTSNILISDSAESIIKVDHIKSKNFINLVMLTVAAVGISYFMKII